MTAADKLRERHDWWNEAPDECAADIAAGDVAAMLPEIAAVIEAADALRDAADARSKLPYDTSSLSKSEHIEYVEVVAAFVTSIGAYDEAVAALNARLDGAA